MASARWTGRAEGDLRVVGASVDAESLSGGRDAAWAKQVHGSAVVVVGDISESGQDADALVTERDDLALLVFTADCAPIALAAPEGIVGVAHGGWRGLVDGVIDRIADEMRRLGASEIQAGLGPCIRPCCYSFGAADLEDVATTLGPSVRGEDSGGRPALDLPAAVRAAVGRAHVDLVFESPSCTGCESERFWSHRVRGDAERQGVLAWVN